MTALYLYDDARARTFEPFALTRPVSELRAGTSLIRERWERVLDTPAVASITAPHLRDFEEPGAPPAAVDDVPAGAIVANSRCVPALGWSDRAADVWTCGGRVAAVRLGRATELAALADGAEALEALGTSGTRVVEMQGRWLDEVWSLITTLVPQLAEDVATLGPELDCAPPQDATVVGGHAVFAERGATVEPLVCLDATAGPILVRRGAAVRAFTRLVGPCYVGEGSTVLGGRIAACSVGETSFVHGEMSETVVLGHTNKSHDGFVGHSYLGRWVNLGAGTITSNLKNTYGTVSLWTPGGLRDTGTMKLGTFFGDHVKTGIGLRLTTGSVVGAGSNVYGSRMPGKCVPAFSWGEGDELTEYEAERFLLIAARAMSRRGIILGEGGRRQLRAAHARARGGQS